MARPRIDADRVKEQIIEIARELVIESGGKRLVLSDIADRMGVSQPYIYTHFKNKQALFAVLAERWFTELEEAGQAICATERAWQCKLRDLIQTFLTIKKAEYERDPALFVACLELASPHRDIVERHVAHLHGLVREILAEIVPPSQLDTMAHMVLDATSAFRVPHEIARSPARATPERADEVIAALIHYLESCFAENLTTSNILSDPSNADAHPASNQASRTQKTDILPV